MHYLLIIAHDDAFAPTEHLVAGIIGWIKSMEARGIRVQGNPLRPASEAVTVRVRNGEVSHSPGPFSHSREQMCAYELIQCASLDVAVEVAARHPMAAVATIEVRPVWSQLAED
ncbi:YciI family protein [Ideonella sp.]|uniref:YciI family protein n=1 Tax=Ideonella sp. TaxID=1929293 RepID=UPI002B48A111|nr:YciI family protein [Ideonella sp.]HJV67532.1 YciI family protein [Ideonella sp.]